MSIEKLNQIWPEWKAESLLGEGSFGKVYKVVREEHGMTAYSAVKVISIPQNDAEVSSVRSEGLSEGETKSYFQKKVNDLVNEIKLMIAMQGTSYIVSITDFKVVEKTDKVGWDVFIRMELLQSFINYISEKKLDEKEVIKIGEDILGALELCSQRKPPIIHRDIKPANIFKSSVGFFKLGDFGIARELTKTAGSMTQVGTYNYMAPEVAKSPHYDSTVDTYSLGIVMYKLLNNNRLPFIPPDEPLAFEKALARRLNGESLPAPSEASESMAQVILKACAFNPRDRYQTPEEFKKALETVKAGGTIPVFEPTEVLDASGTITGRRAPEAKEIEYPNESQIKRFDGQKKKSKKPLILTVTILLVCVLGVGGYFLATNLFINPEVGQAIKIIEALENNNYREAVALFNDVDEKDMETVEDRLSKRIDALKTEFINETNEYNVVKMELGTIRDFKRENLSNKTAEVEQFVDNLHNSRVAFTIAETLFENGDYPGAIEHYQLVSSDDANYDRARNGMANAVAKHKETSLNEAAILADNKDFGRAMDMLEKALLIVGNDAEIVMRRNSYKKQDITNKISNAQELVAGGDYPGAINNLKLSQAQYPDDEDISKAVSSLEDGYINIMLADAAILADDRDYETAVALLNEALSIVPNNASLRSAIAEYEAKFPVLLSSLVERENNRSWALSSGHGEVQDNTFVIRRDAYWWSRGSGQGGGTATSWMEFDLGRQYSCLEGLIFLLDSASETAGRGAIKVWGDGRLIYESPRISKGFQPEQISINISGVNVLRVGGEITFEGFGQPFIAFGLSEAKLFFE